jgi:histidinol phosphatase-like PHP family hydrolase
MSDGELIPSELVRRAVIAGYRAIAITDHADHSNYDFIIPRVINVCRRLSKSCNIVAIPGVELTHVHPGDIPDIAKESRSLGAKIIVVHGETIVEPVIPGTNRAALHSDIDILAHPGFLSREDAGLAAERGIHIEITARRGHCLTNGHVASVARKSGALLLINSDSHSPGDLVSKEFARKIAAGAGLVDKEIAVAFRNAEILSGIAGKS